MQRTSCWAIAAAMVLVAAARGQDLANPGPFQVGVINITLNVPGDGPQPAYLYYPSANGAVDPSQTTYPAVVLSHGFLQPASQYASTMSHLASHGYFVLGFDGQTGLFPDHQEYVDGVRSSLDFLQTSNATVGSGLYGRVNVNEFGLIGHSLGGGVSIVEAASDPRVKAVVGLAPADTFTSPSGLNSIANVQAPIRFLVGTSDYIASLSGSTQPYYNNAQDPKQLLVLDGGGHVGFEDSFSFPESTTMSRAEQLEITRREVTTFLDFYLKNDESRWRQVWGPDGPQSANISQVQLDSGISMLSASSLPGSPGSPTTFNVTLTNTSRWASTFDLFADDQHWNTALSTSTTPLLQPGQSTSFTVTVAPPAGEFNSQDQVLLSARSGHDGLTRQYVLLTTTTGEGTELAAASLNNRSLVVVDTAGNSSVLQGPAQGLVTPIDVKYDAQGNRYAVDTLLNRVTRTDTAGHQTIVATIADGLLLPTAVAVDAAGDVFISSNINNQIIKIAAGGGASIFADAADGLDSPFGLTVDATGNVYAASIANHCIVKIDAAGNASVFADQSDGLFTPIDVKIGPNGLIYVADVLRGMIFTFDAAGVGSVFADRADGLSTPSGMAFDHAGNLFVSNYLANTIVQLTPAGIGSLAADVTDGLDSPFGLAETPRAGGAPQLAFAAVAQVPEADAMTLLAAAGLLAAGGCFLKRMR